LRRIFPGLVSRFAVAAHPRDGEPAWFAPAGKDECRVPVDGKVMVTRTRDGGRSFDVLRQGLPQEQAYDLTTATPSISKTPATASPSAAPPAPSG
jgi:hypothetical protein